MEYKTEQERFWAGQFGDEYIDRNIGEKLIASNTALFSKIISRTTSVSSVIEFGANIGLNLIALRRLLPGVHLSAVEINKKAVIQLKRIEGLQVYSTSILDFKPTKTYDLVLTKGVMIHINPDKLQNVYELLHKSSNKYICVTEYYNPTPVEVVYRGHKGKLFKRDFAGELLEKYSDLELLDYGFVYHRDHNFPKDDTTWFLLKKCR